MAILHDCQFDLSPGEVEEAFQVAGASLVGIKQLNSSLGMEVWLDSQARTTSTNSCLFELILCFVRMNIEIIFWDTQRVLALEPLNPSNIDNISSDRSRQLFLSIHTWALWADVLWDGRGWRGGGEAVTSPSCICFTHTGAAHAGLSPNVWFSSPSGLEWLHGHSCFLLLLGEISGLCHVYGSLYPSHRWASKCPFLLKPV